ncbi:MAG: S8 family serine peptidase [Bacteroidia bacterium]|nr:S8 family serine peptidase [Bacteroidia bacterium]
MQIEDLDGRPPMDGATIFALTQRISLVHTRSATSFDWSMADDYTLWSAVVAGDSTVVVGYKPATLDSINHILHLIDLNNPDWMYARDYTIEFVRQQLQILHPGTAFPTDTFLLRSHEVLPILYFKLSDYEVIAGLRQLGTVVYVEPEGYNENLYAADPIRTSGCNEETDQIESSDYFTISPNSKVSWHLGIGTHRVSLAWDVCPKGTGITLGLIDTGIDSDNTYLSQSGLFTSGQSGGRTIEKFGTFDGTSPHDLCGHGTRMAGILAHPRTNNGGITGIAYKSSLVSYRVANGVILDGTEEKEAVVDALTALGDRSDVRIISMSVGKVFEHQPITQAIKYAYGKGKLIFCAAGGGYQETHPAKSPSLANEVVAVTAAKYDYNDPNHVNLTKALYCPFDTYVDFAGLVEENMPTKTRFALSTQLDNGASLAWSKKASAATATTAGIAALVWSCNLNRSRAQVLAILQQAGSRWGNVSTDYGYGVIDAKEAVDLANIPLPLTVQISEPSVIEISGTYLWTATVANSTAPNLTYTWKWNGTTVATGTNVSSYTRSVIIPSSGTVTSTLSLTIIEQGGLNRTQTASQPLLIGDPAGEME